MTRKSRRFLAVVAITIIVTLTLGAVVGCDDCDIEIETDMDRTPLYATLTEVVYQDQVIERAITLTVQAGGSR